MKYRGKTYAMVNAKCPYYKYEKLTNIVCDGMDNSIVKTAFKSEDEKDTFIIGHCMKYPNECPLCVGLDMLNEDIT